MNSDIHLTAFDGGETNTVMAGASEAEAMDAYSRVVTGVAEAVIRLEFDPVDIVTEVINRVESALEKAVAQGAGKSVAQAAMMSAAAVA